MKIRRQGKIKIYVNILGSIMVQGLLGLSGVRVPWVSQCPLGSSVSLESFRVHQGLSGLVRSVRVFQGSVWSVGSVRVRWVHQGPLGFSASAFGSIWSLRDSLGLKIQRTSCIGSTSSVHTVSASIGSPTPVSAALHCTVLHIHTWGWG